jgi:S1-C subfamily serine protease
VEGPDLRRRLTEPLHGLHTRFALAAAVGVLAAGTAAGLAFARTGSARIGTGVVVIDTNLAYQSGQGAGTGMVLTSSGEVLTNNHVIRGATTIKIVVPGTGRSYTAKVVGYDVSDDVAVLQARGAANLKTVSLGNSAEVRRGQSVKAIGNAGGAGHLVRVSGTVTAVARAVTVSDERGGTEHLTGLIETNAALQAGDSGGPLLNAGGKVIGMDTAAATSSGFVRASSGEGYAIPINKAVAIARRIEGGRVSARIHVGGTAFLGVEVVANQYGGSGATIAAVVQNSPAASAGLVPGDLITGLAGHSISSPAQLTSLVLREKPGARASLRYLDQAGAVHTTTVTLASGPPQ